MSMMSYINYNKVKAYYNALDNKKRLITIMISMGLIILIWYLFFMLPLQGQLNSVSSEAIDNLSHEIKASEITLNTLLQATESSNIDNKEAHAIFYDHLEKLSRENKIESNVDNVIKNLLNNRLGLELNDFHSKEMTVPEKFASLKTPFKPYDISLSLSGPFLQVASYIKQFEKPEIPLYFENFSYGLTQYPEGKLTLSIITLVSNNEMTELDKEKT
jgi:hypothetical protein